ncbi:MAG: asparagine synthase (glutamine-hydrolyzing) [Terriglobales bacterium]
MCGICGCLNFEPRNPVPRPLLEAMNLQIRHRGPDDDGFYLSGNVGLAMRRLCIIDLQTGHQPLSNEDDSLWLVYNGEIYNHQDLRRELEARGHRYRTRTDSETVIHLYEEYGRAGIARLEGMFAFALWDQKRRRLLLARDGMGIKPLYYRHDGERIIFGSEIKAILAHPAVKPELETAVLPEYLAFGYYSGPETFFRGIHKLMPGHWLEIGEDGRVEIGRYWDLPAPQPGPVKSRQFYVNGYRERLEAAVQSHLMSDVPLGVFLSGGLDSSAVAALTAKLRQEPIETFAVGYEETQYSELPYAAEVARHIGARHHEIRVSRAAFMDALPAVVWQEDEPPCWDSSVPLYLLAHLARERVTVVLTGEGSDETQAGYTRYAISRWNARWQRPYGALVPGPLRAWVRARANGKLRHTFLGQDGAGWEGLYFENFFAAFPASAQRELLAPELASLAETAYRNPMAYWQQARGDVLQRMLRTDMGTYLTELLMKQDAMSMAASLESRVPFLDRELVEFALQIPARYQLHGLAGKLVLKQAVADLLPAAIISRTKMGFPTPSQLWLLGPERESVERLLLGARAQQRRLFRPDMVRSVLAEALKGGAQRDDRIWRLLTLELWQRIFLDRDPDYLPSAAPAAAAGAGGGKRWAE